MGTPRALMDIALEPPYLIIKPFVSEDQFYREAGIEEMWFVDPFERRVRVDRTEAGGYVSETLASGRLSCVPASPPACLPDLPRDRQSIEGCPPRSQLPAPARWRHAGWPPRHIRQP